MRQEGVGMTKYYRGWSISILVIAQVMQTVHKHEQAAVLVLSSITNCHHCTMYHLATGSECKALDTAYVPNA